MAGEPQQPVALPRSAQLKFRQTFSSALVIVRFDRPPWTISSAHGADVVGVMVIVVRTVAVDQKTPSQASEKKIPTAPFKTFRASRHFLS